MVVRPKGWLILGLLLAACLLIPPGMAGAQEGRQLTYGTMVEGRVDRSSDREVFFFQARRGDVVSLQMTPTSGNLDPLLLLLNSDSQLIMRADDRQGLGAAIESLQIPDDGLYVVVATRFGHALGLTEGDFTLSLSREGVIASAGMSLSYGEAVVGFINADAPVVTYTFDAQRGDIISLHMRRLAGNLDPYVYIANASGQVLVDNDDHNGTFDAAIEGYLILDSGTYTAYATRYGREAGISEGSFVLEVDTGPRSGLGLTPDAALFIRYGESLNGTLDDENSLRYYTFGAQRGDVVTVHMDRVNGDVDSLLLLLDADQNTLAEDDDSGPSNNALIQSFVIPATGTYFLLATRFERETGLTSGEYTLRLEGITGEVPIVGPGTPTILYGSTLTGRIDDSTLAVTYAFLATEGDMVTVTMSSPDGDLDPLLFLLTDDGRQLATDDDSGPERDARISGFVIPADGTYYLVATRFDMQDGKTRGAYTISLAREAAAGDAPESS